MQKEIEIVLFEKGWIDFFYDILKERRYDYKKYNLKFSIKNNIINNEKVDLGIIFTFKKEGNNIYGSFVFGMESEKNISQNTIHFIKNIIGNFIQHNKDIVEKNIKINNTSFEKTGCVIIEFSLSENYSWKMSTTTYFKMAIKLIYELFYFDIAKNQTKQTVFIENPIIENLSFGDKNDNVEIPDWLEGSGLENKNNEKSETKITKLSLEDMGGNKNLKIEIGKLISFYKNKDHFKKWNIEPPRGVILYGPPGTGKTLTAKIIASEIGVDFYTLSSTDVMSKWIGESAQRLKDFFKKIKSPCIVFMDEIDALVPKRDGNRSGREPHEEEIQTINALLQEIDGLGEKKDILFIGATNRIESMDPAILRAGRLDFKIFVDYPDLEARKEIWNIYLKKAKQKTNYDFLGNTIDLDILAKNTDKFTGSDINEIVRRLLNDYAIGSLFSRKVNEIINGETTLKGLLYIINKYKDEKIIHRNIVPIKPNVRLSDIGGSIELKKEIKKLIEQYKNKEKYEKLGATFPRGIMLYGPPGTGKTLAAKAIAGEIGEIFYSIKASDIQSSIVNASVEKMEKIFKEFESPSIVFIDEIDAIAKKRTGSFTSDEDTKVLNSLLQYIDGFTEKKEILFIGATNRIETIDEALLRAGRFDYKILVDYPDFEARKEIWNIYLTKAKNKTKYDFLDKKINIDILSRTSEKFTGSDINEILRRVLNDFALGEGGYNEENGKINGNIIFDSLIKHINMYKDERMIHRDIVPLKSTTKLSDIGGSIELKKEINKIIHQYKNKEIFEELGVVLPRGILLYGPPGTGKTLAAKAIAGEIDQIFYSIKGSDFYSKWINESVEKMEKIFKEFESPCIVFIDEIDAIAKKRDGSHINVHEEDIKVLNTLLQYIDGFGEKKDILFIGATNRIEALDDAILRAGRFDYKILVDYPDIQARKEIFGIYIDASKTKSKKIHIFETNINYDKLAQISDKMTGADINEVIRRVKENFAIQQISQRNNNSNTYELKDCISSKEIIQEIKKYKKEKNGETDIKKIGFDL